MCVTDPDSRTCSTRLCDLRPLGSRQRMGGYLRVGYAADVGFLSWATRRQATHKLSSFQPLALAGQLA
jgi:hypothetical protein